ncbi:hypothetical protein 9L [Ranavirus ambystoma1]|uniref:Uncharacterized protein n=2 Tax=Ranavirus ambystoma1 TaxID=265294 RepID=A0A0U2QAN6_9VIRU|nr:hypothetical protein ATVp09 [Ambystoma tigrinum virus]AAP33186.1 unknown [Ambystoma tigrinum stebbensi virus]ALN36400.1 hypothetical protein 9L [Ambystoma tigrinum virus]ALN36504.1 hypothetical protein 9L [Ambystoma tigrinum virus]ALN37412.1 hypothetical protein 9L [Ambystoma tigrinum virus]ALN37606.1 hypothetical protein 9L [Ambystoma tigrinum virus]
MYEYVRVVCAFPSAVWQMEILCVFFRIQDIRYLRDHSISLCKERWNTLC